MSQTVSEEVRLANDMLTARILALLDKHPELNGAELPVPGLRIYKHIAPKSDLNCFYTLSTGLILQGGKRVKVDGKNWEYGKCTCIATAADTPSSYEIYEASAQKPYVSISIKLDPLLITEMVQSHPEILAKHGQEQFHHEPRVFTVDVPSFDMIEAYSRLVRLLDTPEQISARAPLIEREIVYLLLMSDQGGALSHFFTQNSTANRINKTINWIRQHTGEPFDIDMLAEMANMTRSTYYRHFKSITKLSPLQYHKRQCLYQAQHLMMTKGYSATQAAYEVGYLSPNQFSREYKRTFGLAPRQFVTAQTQCACNA